MRYALLLVTLFVAGLFSAPSRAEERAAKAFKGIELYSWKTPAGEWRFTLLHGTNDLKSREDVLAGKQHAKSVKELGDLFAKLAEGEHVSWHHREVVGMEYPDAQTVKAVQDAAASAKLDFYATSEATGISDDPVKGYVQWVMPVVAANERSDDFDAFLKSLTGFLKIRGGICALGENNVHSFWVDIWHPGLMEQKGFILQVESNGARLSASDVENLKLGLAAMKSTALIKEDGVYLKKGLFTNFKFTTVPTEEKK